ncbi:MAG: hypothetical protein HY814_04725 [Candidatus Riflebacteria bacterium]|nr:hypothetical protein [Candidatus Riflebacteria bacterium]
MRHRLMAILAAAALALIVTGRTSTVAPTSPDAGSPPSNLVQAVPADHWAYPALQQLGDGKNGLQLAPGPNGSRPVTRFEMAVLLTRIMERLDQTVGGKLPAEKLELLDKLYKEFRGDLENIGTDLGGLKSRLDELARKVEDASKTGGGALVKQVFDATQKADAAQARAKEQDRKLEALSAKLTQQTAQTVEGQKKSKVYAEVLAKVLVKVARLEKSAGTGDGGGLNRTNLNELRGLIKEFAVDFERRLAQVEHSRSPGRVQLPVETRLPRLSGNDGPGQDADHILDATLEPDQPPRGPVERGLRPSGAESAIPEDRI